MKLSITQCLLYKSLFLDLSCVVDISRCLGYLIKFMMFFNTKRYNNYESYIEFKSSLIINSYICNNIVISTFQIHSKVCKIMPKTNNAFIRQKVIDKCLRSIKNFSTNDIMRECNRELELRGERPITSCNTIREDINKISSNYPEAIIDQVKHGRNVYYSYRNKNYSIYKIPFTDEELAQLTQTLSLLSHFEGMPHFEWLDNFFSEFKSYININDFTRPIVGFEENFDLKGRNYFSTLFNAINNKQVLTLKYKNFKRKEELLYIVHPYYLKEYNNRWFLLGYSENIGKLSIFAFDRIEDIILEHRDYIESDIYDFKEYFDEMIGVSKSLKDSVQKVELWISSNLWPYIETKPLHGTQKIISRNTDGTIIQIEVYLNYELKQKILSFGSGIKVLAPAVLKNDISEEILNACKNYQ